MGGGMDLGSTPPPLSGLDNKPTRVPRHLFEWGGVPTPPPLPLPTVTGRGGGCPPPPGGLKGAIEPALLLPHFPILLVKDLRRLPPVRPPPNSTTIPSTRHTHTHILPRNTRTGPAGGDPFPRVPQSPRFPHNSSESSPLTAPTIPSPIGPMAHMVPSWPNVSPPPRSMYSADRGFAPSDRFNGTDRTGHTLKTKGTGGGGHRGGGVPPGFNGNPKKCPRGGGGTPDHPSPPYSGFFPRWGEVEGVQPSQHPFFQLRDPPHRIFFGGKILSGVDGGMAGGKPPPLPNRRAPSIQSQVPNTSERPNQRAPLIYAYV